MQNSVYWIATSAFVAAFAITFVVADESHATLPFIMGAIVGAQVGPFVGWRTGATEFGTGEKLYLGAALAAVAALIALVIHTFIRSFTYAEVTIPIAVFGSAAFPFAVSGTIWKHLSNMSKAGD